MIITCSIFQLSHNLIPLQDLPVFLKHGSSTDYLFSLTNEGGSITQWSGGAGTWSLEFETPSFLSGHTLFQNIRVDVKTRQLSHHHIQIVFHEEGYNVSQEEISIDPPDHERLTYEELPSPLPHDVPDMSEQKDPGQTLSSPLDVLHGLHFDGEESHVKIPKRHAEEIPTPSQDDRPIKRPRVDSGPRRSRRLMEKENTYFHLLE